MRAETLNSSFAPPPLSLFPALHLRRQCTCDEDYEYDQQYGPCGQYVVGHSHWPGRQM